MCPHSLAPDLGLVKQSLKCIKTYVFVLLLSPSAPMLPLHRSDSPPLLDKVGLTEERGAPRVWGLQQGRRFRFVPPSSLSLYMSKTGRRGRADRSTSADFSPGHTPQAFSTTATPPSSVAFNILIYRWLVIESHCFWGWGGREGWHCLLKWMALVTGREGHTGMKLNGLPKGSYFCM